MTIDLPSVPLATVLADLGPAVTVVAGDVSLPLSIHGTSVWIEPDEIPVDPGVALICPGLRTADGLDQFLAKLSSQRRVIFIPSSGSVTANEMRELTSHHIIVVAEAGLNAAQLVTTVSKTLSIPEESISRRLASLQRALSQAVSEPEPIPALLGRLAKVCNATAVLVDRSGRTVHATGPIPMSLLFDEIARTDAESQKVDVDGWRGVAARIAAPVEGDSHFGWLVVTARRRGFPDSYSTSAVHVAATLVEASQRMAVVARQQERAIRTAVLEEALALRREPNNPELAGRISAFGLSFEDELRALVFRPIRSSVASKALPNIEAVAELLGKSLESQAMRHLMTTKNKVVVVIAQCSVQALRRLVVSEGSTYPEAHIGIGRRVHALGDILDSYQDAQLAVRTLRRNSKGSRTMAYEDFDYATRLFADVGFDKMIAWAQEFLKPLEGRELLIEGLQTFFEHSQNINAAADHLEIHHNSLRYRLSKAEEILNISLREPAAVSSVFLALTALELGRVQQPRPRVSADSSKGRKPSDVEAADFLPYSRPTTARGGVVNIPGR